MIDKTTPELKGCGELTNVVGTNDGKLPCGCTFVSDGVKYTYHCYKCCLKFDKTFGAQLHTSVKGE
jgi:hypothetical protein